MLDAVDARLGSHPAPGLDMTLAGQSVQWSTVADTSQPLAEQVVEQLGQTGTLAVIWLEIKTTKRELGEDLKASEGRQQEARQREETRELRSDVKALGEKVDRLVESLVTVRQA